MSPELMKKDAELRAKMLRGWATDNKVGTRPAVITEYRANWRGPQPSGQFGAVTQPSPKSSCKRMRAGLPRNAKEHAKYVKKFLK